MYLSSSLRCLGFLAVCKTCMLDHARCDTLCACQGMLFVALDGIISPLGASAIPVAPRFRMTSSPSSPVAHESTGVKLSGEWGRNLEFLGSHVRNCHPSPTRP
jgi:hypothetical protein